MSNYQTGLDILQDVLFRAGEKTEMTGSVSDYLDAAKRYVMRSYYDIISSFPYRNTLADPPGVINTVDKVTGTATCTKGSATVTFGATITPSMAGRKFCMDNEGIVYRIATHTSGTDTATIDATYKEESVSGAFTLYQDEYSLAADCLKLWFAWNRGSFGGKINVISEDYAHEMRDFKSAEGSFCNEMTIIRGGKVRIRPWVGEATTIEYEYTVRPATLTFDGVSATDTPLISEENRQVIADAALYFLHMDKNDSRAENAFKIGSMGVSGMKGQELQSQKPRWYPKPGQGIWR